MNKRIIYQIGISYTQWTFIWISEPSLTYLAGQSWWCGGEPNNAGGNSGYVRENVIQIVRQLLNILNKIK